MPDTPATERRSPPVVWVALGLLLAVAIVAWGVTSFRAPDGAAVTAGGSGGAMPAFDLAALDGRRVGPAVFEGRVVLYDFWATWCGPCHLQSDILKSIYPEAKGRGAEFVGVATGEPAGVVRDFLARRPLPYPVLLDPESRLESELAIYGLPTLVVVDRRGRIAYRHTGLIDADTLRRVLAAAESS
jgi:peroxiredoxin